MRITGGLACGIPLRLPARGEIRPATDYLREAVFSSLGAFVPGARVLDFFAGTGAYGLEAISRGARSAVFVEKNPAAAVAIRENTAAVAKACAVDARVAGIVTADALRWTPPEGEGGFDLIFCDPPWSLWQEEAEALVSRLAAWFSGPDARIVLEAPGGWSPPVPSGWKLHRQLARGKGQPAASILRPE
ncbi:MAG: RsmD family RNA methyltransferase [Puniceicoccales bacterium]|nr:RsmD family RNA methyltransferase [Puniceicoccales bacterium]